MKSPSTVAAASSAPVPGDVKIDGSVIRGNVSSEGGGIFYLGSSPDGVLTITGSTISSNVVTPAGPLDGNGGGIFSSGSGTVTIADSTVSDNSATLGGGIFTSIEPGSALVTRSNVSGNTAKSRGGGLLHQVGELTARSSTISGNIAPIAGGVSHSPALLP